MRKELRELRKNLVDFGEKILRKSGLADKTICAILRFLHLGISIFTIGLLLFSTRFWFFVVVSLNILIYLLYFVFEGCILSKLEHRFTDDEYTVIDPFLILFKIELTNDNRYKYSFISSVFGAMATVALYYIRFSKSASAITKSSALYDNDMTTKL